MTITINGTTGIAGVDGSASTPAVQGTDTNTGIFFPAADTIAFGEGGAEVARFNADAQFVAAAGTALLPVITTTGDVNTGIFFPAADTIAFSEGGTEAMRINSSGQVGVGATSLSGKFTIKGGNGDQLILDNDGSQYTQVYFQNNGTSKAYQWWDNTNTRFQIQSGASGGVYLANTGTSWTSASDERVKNIVEPIENANEKLANWRTVIGKYKTDEEGVRRSFLIAQDVLATFPEAVDTTNANEYGLSYQDLIPVLVKATQELKAELDEAKARLAALEAK